MSEAGAVDNLNPVTEAKKTRKYIDPRTGVPYYVDNRGPAPRSTWTAPKFTDSTGRETFTIPVKAENAAR